MAWMHPLIWHWIKWDLASYQAIQEIDEVSQRQFGEAFEQINVHFGQMFQNLFGGGQGMLRLTEAENAADQGVEIIAQPPGKKLQSVLLLSGATLTGCYRPGSTPPVVTVAHTISPEPPSEPRRRQRKQTHQQVRNRSQKGRFGMREPEGVDDQRQNRPHRDERRAKSKRHEDNGRDR